MKELKVTKWTMLLAAAGLLWTSSVQATFVVSLGFPDPASEAKLIDTFFVQGNNPRLVAGYVLENYDVVLGSSLYKINNNGSEEGAIPGRFSTDPTPWFPEGSGDFPILISYSGSGAISPTYLIVKDGNAADNFVLFDISAWDPAEESLAIYNMFRSLNKTITGTSHVEIFGAVPEPSTIMAGAMLLLPFGVSVLRALRRRRAA